MKTFTYNSSDIFIDTPDGSGVIMNIPDEVLQALGWCISDVITVSVVDNSIVLSKNTEDSK